MAQFEKKEINLTDINNGQKYVNGDIVDADAINAPIEASAWAQETAKNAQQNSFYAKALATNQPDFSEIDGVGSPNVTISQMSDGSPRLKFSNLKGEKGDKGDAENIQANPNEEATEELEKVKINGVTYSLPIGGGEGTYVQKLQIEAEYPTDYGTYLVHLILDVREQRGRKIVSFQSLFDYDVTVLDFRGTVDTTDGETTDITGVILYDTFLDVRTQYETRGFDLSIQIGGYLHELEFEGVSVGNINDKQTVNLYLATNFTDVITDYSQIEDYYLYATQSDNINNDILIPFKKATGIAFIWDDLSWGMSLYSPYPPYTSYTYFYIYNPEKTGLVFTEKSLIKQNVSLTNITDAGVVIDKTLSIENAAADAKATGDRLKALEEGGSGESITVNSELSTESENPVQNKVIAKAIGDIETALDNIIDIQNALIGGNS